jgi:hypothetical protein
VARVLKRYRPVSLGISTFLIEVYPAVTLSCSAQPGSTNLSQPGSPTSGLDIYDIFLPDPTLLDEVMWADGPSWLSRTLPFAERGLVCYLLPEKLASMKSCSESWIEFDEQEILYLPALLVI